MAISGVALQSPALVSGYPIDTYFSAYRPIQWGWAFVASAGEELTNLVVTVYNSATRDYLSLNLPQRMAEP
jgi:hypothetical protein